MSYTKIIGGIAAAAVLLSGIALGAVVAEAKEGNGNGKGHYKHVWKQSPGNSAYGRSHNPHFGGSYGYFWGGQNFEDIDELIAFFKARIELLRKLQEDRDDDDDDDDDESDEEPDVITGSVDDIEDSSAELSGEIDMNDFDNGVAFFVYGEDLSSIEDVVDDFDTYDEIDEDGDDLQKARLDDDLDGDEDFTLDVDGLDGDTRHYYAIGVQFEDEDGDDQLVLGSVRSFTTD